jgi:hypothetical protein
MNATWWENIWLKLETFVKINRSVIYLNMFTGDAEYRRIIFPANHLTPTVHLSKINNYDNIIDYWNEIINFARTYFI